MLRKIGKQPPLKSHTWKRYKPAGYKPGLVFQWFYHLFFFNTFFYMFGFCRAMFFSSGCFEVGEFVKLDVLEGQNYRELLIAFFDKFYGFSLGPGPAWDFNANWLLKGCGWMFEKSITVPMFWMFSKTLWFKCRPHFSNNPALTPPCFLPKTGGRCFMACIAVSFNWKPSDPVGGPLKSSKAWYVAIDKGSYCNESTKMNIRNLRFLRFWIIVNHDFQ